ncbi:MAG: hypothetical protein IID63_07520 [candidate division Zixibacteria bacterium]|nr:hypothetical protein [candidate division Zixibacteria bacterium]
MDILLFIVAILTLAFGIYKFRTKNKAQVSERSLNTLHQAYKNLMEIKLALYGTKSIAGKGTGKSSENTKPDFEELLNKLNDIESWYHSNRFRLSEEISKQFILLLIHSKVHVHDIYYDGVSKKDDRTWETYFDTYKMIKNQINNIQKKHKTFE